MVPAAMGLILLRQPISHLLFQHGDLAGSQTTQIARALLGYAPQLPFIGIDQLLIFAFYARQNTITPMLAGVAGVLVYIVSALALDHILNLQVLGLAVANTLQISFHTVLLLVLLSRLIGGVEVRGTLLTLGKVLVATAGMSAGILIVHAVAFDRSAGGVGSLVNVAWPMAVAIVIYGVAIWALRLDDVTVLASSIRARLG
jgi:putative peptidoglycan lipid II flippase